MGPDLPDKKEKKRFIITGESKDGEFWESALNYKRQFNIYTNKKLNFVSIHHLRKVRNPTSTVSYGAKKSFK